MKKRLQSIEAHIALKCLKRDSGRHVLIISSEADWTLPEDGDHVFYTVVNSPDQAPGKLAVIATLEALPIANESIDFVILPHAMNKRLPLSHMLNVLNRVLKSNGQLLFFGINDSAQYCASEISQALKKLGYQRLRYRGYHLLPFLGPKLGEVVDEGLGQFLPRFCTGYWLLARKRVYGITPLKVDWKPAKKVLQTGKIRPIAGRFNLESSVDTRVQSKSNCCTLNTRATKDSSFKS